MRAHRHFGGIDSAERPGRGLNAVSSTAQPGALFADETYPELGMTWAIARPDDQADVAARIVDHSSLADVE